MEGIPKNPRETHSQPEEDEVALKPILSTNFDLPASFDKKMLLLAAALGLSMAPNTPAVASEVPEDEQEK